MCVRSFNKELVTVVFTNRLNMTSVTLNHLKVNSACRGGNEYVIHAKIENIVNSRGEEYLVAYRS
jgi:hypothetical protein